MTDVIVDNRGARTLSGSPSGRGYAGSCLDLCRTRRRPGRSMVWDHASGLLMVTGLDNWDAPRDEVIEAVRRFAPALWTNSFDTVRPH